MSPEQPKKASLLEFAATFIILFFLTQFAFKYFFPNQYDKQSEEPTVTLSMQAKSVAEGNNPIVIIHNNTKKELVLPARCPQPQFNIAGIKLKSDGASEVAELIANQTAIPCAEVAPIPAGEKVNVDLAPWKYSLLSELGEYQVTLDLPETFADGLKDKQATTTFSIVEPGIFTKMFRTFVTKPLFNLLLLIASFTPSHNLAISIIILTIIVKLALLVPSQHALEGQKKIQQLQPKLDELKRRYPDDSKKVQEETLRLWKEHKINPLESCLPTLLQFPILIGLFFVVRDGVAIETSRHLAYSWYQHLPPHFLGTTLFGFDLLKPSIIVMPVALVVLQFIQMKMMFAAKKDDKVIDVNAPKWKSWVPKLDQQTMMLYLLPLMIGFFAIKFPAAVSVYWGISTVFGIAQQWVVMRKK